MDKRDLREKNLEITLAALRNLKQASKPMLAKETGLSVVTINAIMEMLIKRGDAELADDTVSVGGRPARLYQLNATKHLALGAYITREPSGFTLTTFVINLFGEVVSGDEVLTNNVNQEFLENQFNKNISKYKEIKIILLGLDQNSYPELKDIDLAEEFENKTNRQVVLFRDIHAAMIGGSKLEGIAMEGQTLIGVSWTPNMVETGILLNGEIYKGRDGFAGSLRSDYNTGDAVNDAGKTLILLTRLFNPSVVIFYNEKLRSNDLNKILDIAKNDVEEKFLPTLIIRPDIREDYGEGMYTLAGLYLMEDKE